jgi:hypothetical protein
MELDKNPADPVFQPIKDEHDLPLVLELIGRTQAWPSIGKYGWSPTAVIRHGV